MLHFAITPSAAFERKLKRYSCDANVFVLEQILREAETIYFII